MFVNSVFSVPLIALQPSFVTKIAVLGLLITRPSVNKVKYTGNNNDLQYLGAQWIGEGLGGYARQQTLF